MAKGFTPKKTIQAAGKTISSKNASAITAARDSIAKGLESLDTVLESAGIEAEEINASNFERAGLISCSEYGDYLKRSNWYNRLRTALDGFGWIFEYALYDGADEAVVEEMIAEFGAEITEVAKLYSVMQASTIQAGNLSIECSSVNLEASTHGNKIPIELKLFECDTISAGIPAKGADKRLYIPREVALSIASTVTSLPLDADPSLRQHCNNSIVGSMVSATVKDDGDFWVRAHLYPFNQPELVKLIRENKNVLGASINAHAHGEDREIDGEVVWYITKLELLGANILYKTCATFDGTELKAEKAIVGPPNNDPTAVIDIAASKTTEEDPQMEETLKAQALLIEKQEASILSLNKAVATIGDGIALLLSDRSEAIEKQQQEVAAAAQAQSIDTLISDRIAALLPNRQPARLGSGPIAASAIPDPETATSRLVELQAGIYALESLGRGDQQTRTQIFKMKDELRTLKAVA